MLHRWMLLSVVVMMSLAQSQAMVIVGGSDARSTVVVADDASAVAKYAAHELVEHIRKAAGVKLQVVPESQVQPTEHGRIFIGCTQAAQEHAIVPADLGDDGFVIRIFQGDLYITGNADGDDPFNRLAGAKLGTLYGVYEFLERFVNVRWLWPGELGTYVLRVETLSTPEQIDLNMAPALQFRRFRSHRIRGGAAKYNHKWGRIGFTEQTLKDYAQDLEIYKSRYRLGDTVSKPSVGHYFAGWWERFGKDHPEWFILRDDGSRGPDMSDTSSHNLRHVPMCISNRGLQRYVLQEAWNGQDWLRLGESDRRQYCQCEDCRKMDEPLPAEHPPFAKNLYTPQMASNRYARFWKTMLTDALKRNPNVKISTFLYMNYMPAPTIDVQFDGAVYGEFVPWGQDEVTFFPMQADAYEWLKQQWMGWKDRGVIMAYRPNYFHGGYVMPHLSTYQAGEFFQFAYRNGMIGFDQDMLIGHWALKGPMFYVHMRLAVHPDLPIEQLRREYFEAFGSAGAHVEQFFDYWERYALGRPGGNLRKPVDAHVAYPAECFKPAEAILARAMSAASADSRPEYAQRVEFLAIGLEHARLVSKLMESLDMGEIPPQQHRLEAARAAMRELVAFRRAHEHLYFADLLRASRQEHGIIDVDTLLGED